MYIGLTILSITIDAKKYIMYQNNKNITLII